MLRQAMLYLVASILVILLAKYAHLLVIYIDNLFNWASLKLAPVFSYTGTGLMMRKILVLVLLPVALAGVPALIYRGIKGSPMPQFLELTWLFWLIIVLSHILIR